MIVRHSPGVRRVHPFPSEGANPGSNSAPLAVSALFFQRGSTAWELIAEGVIRFASSGAHRTRRSGDHQTGRRDSGSQCQRLRRRDGAGGRAADHRENRHIRLLVRGPRPRLAERPDLWNKAAAGADAAGTRVRRAGRDRRRPNARAGCASVSPVSPVRIRQSSDDSLMPVEALPVQRDHRDGVR